MKKLKKMFWMLISLGDIADGFVAKTARKWKKRVVSCYRNKNYPISQIRWATKNGFLPRRAEKLGITKENISEHISEKDYSYLTPINGGYSKWLKDHVTKYYIFKPFRDKFPVIYYHIFRRFNETQIVSLYDDNNYPKVNDILEIVKEKGKVRISPAKGGSGSILQWENDMFIYGEKVVNKEEIEDIIKSFKKSMIITEVVKSEGVFAGSSINFVVFNSEGTNPIIGDAVLTAKIPKNNSESVHMLLDLQTGKILQAKDRHANEIPPINPINKMEFVETVPHWQEICDTIIAMAKHVAQIEFMCVRVKITEDGFRIVNISNSAKYPSIYPFGKETTEFLKGKVERKKAAYKGFFKGVNRIRHKIFLKLRRKFASIMLPKGMVPYMVFKFPADVKKDFLTNKDTTFKEKMWALKHGFISYRLRQYNITEENHHEFISDFEYKWLRHINPSYREWMEDKITVKYICSEFKECFPEYYYHICMKNGNNRIIPMMDCPQGYSNTYEDIFNLVKEKGALALKPDEGSHGDGFYKFSFEDGCYKLNHKEATEQDVINILSNIKNQYLVTEYIDMHPTIKNIYDGAVNTIRMIVFKKDGVIPQIGNAYMRFGSKKTGAVDNMGAGGMFAKIDIDTGRFYDAKIIEANEIKSCPNHPDTGVLIDGILPNWEKVKEQVLAVASNIKQLEYFGFDLAITPEGLKFPEINRFPDYPAIEKYSPETMEYLLYKLKQKKLYYGSEDFDGGRCLMKLPSRK